jgi:hypothetical protein
MKICEKMLQSNENNVRFKHKKQIMQNWFCKMNSYLEKQSAGARPKNETHFGCCLQTN